MRRASIIHILTQIKINLSQSFDICYTIDKKEGSLMIRLLQFQDIDSVMTIWLQSTILAHPFIEESYWMKNYDIVKNIYLPNSTTYVYESEERIQGFISIIEDSFIGALFIAPEIQGKGIGSKLLQEALSHYPKLSLAVYKDNLNATKFYQSKGFKIFQEQVNEDSGHKEYVMIYE